MLVHVQVQGSKWLSHHAGHQEVNLRNPLHTGNKACKQGIHHGFEAFGRHHQKSKTGVSVNSQKGLMSFKKFKKQIKSKQTKMHTLENLERTTRKRPTNSQSYARVFQCDRKEHSQCWWQNHTSVNEFQGCNKESSSSCVRTYLKTGRSSKQTSLNIYTSLYVQGNTRKHFITISLCLYLWECLKISFMYDKKDKNIL